MKAYRPLKPKACAHFQCLSGNTVTFPRTQEHYRRSDMLWINHSLQRSALNEHPFDFFNTATHLFCASCNHAGHSLTSCRTWADGVYLNVMWAQLLSQCARQTEHSPFGGCVGASKCVRHFTRDRADVDDLA